VVKPTAPREGYVEVTVQAETLSVDSDAVTVNGLLLARIDQGIHIEYGDRVFLTGELTTPVEYEDFSYRDHLARQGIHSLMSFAQVEVLDSDQGNPIWAAIYGIRERGLETLYRLYPAREAALLSGILLGDESGLSEDTKTAFNDTGTRHIIAISGFNISIIASLLLTVFIRRLGIRRGIWIAGVGIAIYTLLVGAEASVVRAAIMGILALVALQTGRQAFALNSLGFTAAAMALVNPLVIWDVGFQLSFTATLGIVLYAEPLQSWSKRWLDSHLPEEWARRLSRPINDYVLVTIAAQLTTLPILLYYFHRLSLFSLPANLLILPVQPALMILGGMSLFFGMIIQTLGQVLAFVAWIPTAYTMRVVEWFASLPWVSQSFSDFPFYLVATWFALLVLAGAPALRDRIRKIHLQPIVPLLALTAFTFWTWNSALAAPDGLLHITLLDVNGEAILIRTPEGRNILINGGNSSTQLLNEVSQFGPWRQTLDLIIIAGQRSEQIGALSGSLERLAPQHIAFGVSYISDPMESLWDEAESLGITVSNLNAGDYFDLGNSGRLEIAGVGPRGAVIKLVWNKFEALFPSGIDFDQMEASNYGYSFGPVDLLVLADSGYAPLNPAQWIANLAPSVVWSTGDEEIETDLRDLIGESQLFESSQHGWLQLSTDGEQLWLEVEQ
jgi:competence protein ComEC